jgi:flagellar protein FlgJ
MIKVTDIAGGVALDTQNLNALRQGAREGSPQAIKATAKQMEGLFVNMMLKSMRQAALQEGPMNSEQTRQFSAMLDAQLSQKLPGVGLADMFIKQLSKQTVKPDQVSKMPPVISSVATHSGEASHAHSKSERVKTFFARLAPYAEQASQVTGIPAQFMLGHAALESGWGRREIRDGDGTNSHNLFGIKATKSWHGRTVDCVTHEYINGVACKRVEKFRAYDSYAEAFKDYANLLQANPRYRGVLANASDSRGFAYGLQSAGYATDPHYGAKLTRIIQQAEAV